jgi:hypothetical protein
VRSLFAIRRSNRTREKRTTSDDLKLVESREENMNRSQSKLTLWMLAFGLLLTVAISPALAKAQASAASTNSSAAKPAAPVSPSATPATAKASSQDIAAAKASGKVWVNTESGVYHKSGRWYGKTKNGKFMTEAEAKAAGYKEAH